MCSDPLNTSDHGIVIVDDDDYDDYNEEELEEEEEESHLASFQDGNIYATKNETEVPLDVGQIDSRILDRI